MTTTELFDFAFIPGWYEHLDALAELALSEPWRYRAPPPERRNTRTPVLERYIRAVFRCHALSHLYAATPQAADASLLIRNEYACFNTGLLTRQHKPIYAYFDRNKRMDAKQPWYFRGFAHDGLPSMKYVFPLPGHPIHNIQMAGDFDARLDIRINTDHILGDAENLERIPAMARSFGNLPLLLEAAVLLLKRVALRTPSIIVKQLYRGQAQLLAPLCLTEPEHADLAITMTYMNGYYDCRTCLTPEMAYTNARLLGVPTAPWLTAVVE